MAGQKMTKSQFVAAIAEQSGVSKKQAAAMLEAMNSIIVNQLGKQGPGEITIPGLLKLSVKEKPAVPEHEGINPFTKQPTIIKAKPASRAVKARSVKALNDAV
jgi:nucleoid DNA-binding protein